MNNHALSPAHIHMVFDVAAWAAAFVTLFLLRRSLFKNHPVQKQHRFSYITFLLLGAGLGAWALGSINSYLSDQQGLGRSIIGALGGAIIAIELFKKANQITVRTGAIYAAPIAVGILVGRFGCHFAGLEDFTYGIPTTLPWGYDYGDNILRHPAALYESFSMGCFLCVYIWQIWHKNQFWQQNGFYLFCIWYGGGRFLFEFIKPYAAAALGLTIFQWASIALVAYGIIMLRPNKIANIPNSVQKS